jgi:hypothetical protein
VLVLVSLVLLPPRLEISPFVGWHLPEPRRQDRDADSVAITAVSSDFAFSNPWDLTSGQRNAGRGAGRLEGPSYAGTTHQRLKGPRAVVPSPGIAAERRATLLVPQYPLSANGAPGLRKPFVNEARESSKLALAREQGVGESRCPANSG